MSADTLLIELGTEELPPAALKTLSDAFSAGISRGLTERRLDFKSLRGFASPRRLAVQVEGLALRAPDEAGEESAAPPSPFCSSSGRSPGPPPA